MRNGLNAECGFQIAEFLALRLPSHRTLGEGSSGIDQEHRGSGLYSLHSPLVAGPIHCLAFPCNETDLPLRLFRLFNQ